MADFPEKSGSPTARQQVNRSVILPAQYAKALRNPSVVSHPPFDLSGILVQQFHNPAGHFDIPASSSHCLTIHLRHNIGLKREITKQTQRAQMRPGAVTFTPAFHESQWDADGAADVFYLHIEPRFLSAVTQKDIGQTQALITKELAIDDPQIGYLGMALKSELEAGSPSGRLFYEGVASALALRLAHRFYHIPPADCLSGRTALPSFVTQVTNYIEAHLDADLSLAEMAGFISMSVPHFCTQFKQAFGIPPHRFVIQCRVERAKQLLISGVPISEAARRVGFADQSHLTRHMRRFLGVTPGAFKRR